MTNLRPPGYLTTSELGREIAALETALADMSCSGNKPEDARLGALYAEREQRKRLADRHLRSAGTQFPDGAS